jgi:UDP-N-acetylmuramate dehydrogenase
MGRSVGVAAGPLVAGAQAGVALKIERDVPLAGRTTLELGGPARELVRVTDEDELRRALEWARANERPLVVLGGGSNVVVADEGVDALVVELALRGVRVIESEGRATIVAAAGEPWDPLVASAVDRGWAGLECLSGIPGSVGATPIQNVGAYGQDVAETIARVRVLDRRTLDVHVLAADACEFAYRDSAFKHDPERWIVLEVELALRTDGVATVRYPELQRALGPASAPALADVRAKVLDLRRAKSMVLDRDDENRRSVGSFFTNPIVTHEHADRVIAEAVERRLAASAADVPCFAAGEGRTKLAAAWLIERAGFVKGERRGAVGISSRHALALVHHGGGTTRDLLALAREIADRVQERFSVALRPEPTLLGVAW